MKTNKSKKPVKKVSAPIHSVKSKTPMKTPVNVPTKSPIKTSQKGSEKMPAKNIAPATTSDQVPIVEQQELPQELQVIAHLSKKEKTEIPKKIMTRKVTNDTFARCQIEALLFASGKTMSEEQLSTLAKLELPAVKRALTELKEEYSQHESAIAIYDDPTGWRMMIKEQYIGTIKNIVADTELTRACMETLAIIAYKYPKVLQSEVIDIRGSGAYEHMAELERLGFIRREPEGRSYAVKLTDKFFSYFEVAGGKDLRDVFRDVKLKPKVVAGVAQQKTLGDMQVIDVEPRAQKPTLAQQALGAANSGIDGLEVVDVAQAPPQATTTTASEQEADDPEHGRIVALEDEQEHNDFLADLDRRIAQITERNTRNDEDETLRRKPLPGAEETLDAPDSTIDESTTDASDEEKKE